MKELIEKYTLQNAIKFKGKANPGAIIGKLFSDDPSLKENVADLGKEIAHVVAQINKLSLDDQIQKLKEIAPELLDGSGDQTGNNGDHKAGSKADNKNESGRAKRRDGLAPLKNAESGKVVMRFAPSPSGPMHIGHALTLSTISEFCRMYDGKLIFRIEDTNPDNIYSPAYDMMPIEAQWITENNVDQFIIQSDRLEIYYDYIEKLLNVEAVYVCDCDPEKYRELISKKKPCPCRNLTNDEQVLRWNRMLNRNLKQKSQDHETVDDDFAYKQGQAVMRLKTKIDDPNPAMRDFPIARINESEHPRRGTRYRVWPLMNLSVFVDDVESGMTHIVRGKDHADNAKRQEYLYNYLKKPIPETLFQGKVNFTDMQLSCSKTKKAIAEGLYDGWDDIRLSFLGALKRRGYQPGSIVKWALSIGVSLADKTVSKNELFKSINRFNKELIEADSNRYFFINAPVKIKIENAPGQEIELDLHPENRKGGRKFSTTNEFLITKEDFEIVSKLKDGKLVRLMDCLNFRKENNQFVFDSQDYETFKSKGGKIIHWLSAGDKNIEIEILMPDKTLIKGLAEPLVNKLVEDTVIQFERFGFCRLDENSKEKMLFWFAHK